MESLYLNQYEQQLEAPHKSAKKDNIYDICFAFDQCVFFIVYAASFRYGGYLVSCEGLHHLVAMTDWPSGALGVFPVGRLTIGADATQNINNPSPLLNKNNQVLCV